MQSDKDKQISKNLRQLKKLVALVPENKQAIAEKLAGEIAFMAATLEELKKTINEKGATDLFKQGSQQFLRENPAMKSYNTTIQRYSLLYKQLADLLPKQEQELASDNGLYEFIKKG